MFAAQAVKEEEVVVVVVVVVVVCAAGETGVGVPQHHHRSPSCLPVTMKNDNPASCQLSGPLFLTLSELKPESAPPVCWR